MPKFHQYQLARLGEKNEKIPRADSLKSFQAPQRKPTACSPNVSALFSSELSMILSQKRERSFPILLSREDHVRKAGRASSSLGLKFEYTENKAADLNKCKRDLGEDQFSDPRSQGKRVLSHPDRTYGGSPTATRPITYRLPRADETTVQNGAPATQESDQPVSVHGIRKSLTASTVNEPERAVNETHNTALPTTPIQNELIEGPATPAPAPVQQEHETTIGRTETRAADRLSELSLISRRVLQLSSTFLPSNPSDWPKFAWKTLYEDTPPPNGTYFALPLNPSWIPLVSPAILMRAHRLIDPILRITVITTPEPQLPTPEGTERENEGMNSGNNNTQHQNQTQTDNHLISISLSGHGDPTFLHHLNLLADCWADLQTWHRHMTEDSVWCPLTSSSRRRGRRTWP